MCSIYLLTVNIWYPKSIAGRKGTILYRCGAEAEIDAVVWSSSKNSNLIDKFSNALMYRLNFKHICIIAEYNGIYLIN